MVKWYRAIRKSDGEVSVKDEKFLKRQGEEFDIVGEWDFNKKAVVNDEKPFVSGDTPDCLGQVDKRKKVCKECSSFKECVEVS